MPARQTDLRAPTTGRPAGGRRALLRRDLSPGRRFSEVDLMRLVAAAAVIGFHFLFRASTGDRPLARTGFTDPETLFRYGYLGVDLFFVISGFVILRSAWGRSPSAFLASRIGRLYPAFWVACTLTAVVVTLVPFDRFQVTPLQWLANLTMASEAFGVPYVDGVYWTLAVELAFYLLILGLSLVGITTGRVLAFAAGWLALSVVHAFWPLSGGWELLLVPEWTPYFVAGILFALVARDGWRRRYVALLLPATGWSLYRALDFAAVLTEKYDVTFSPVVVGGVVLGIFAAMALVASGYTLPAVARVAWLGGLTYPLYLLHENIGFVLFEAGNTLLGLDRWVVLAATLGVITALAWWLHVAVENRFAQPLSRAVHRTWVRVKIAAATASPVRSASGSLVDRAALHGYTPSGQLLNR